MNKAICGGIFTILLIMVGLFANPLIGKASAASHIQLASCYSESCNGLNPSKYGCVSGEILRWYGDLISNGSKVGRVEQWYSPSCDAIWTNTQTYYTYHGTTYLSANISRDVSPQGGWLSYTGTVQNGQNVHTSMAGFFLNTCYESYGFETYGQQGLQTGFTHCY